MKLRTILTLSLALCVSLGASAQKSKKKKAAKKAIVPAATLTPALRSVDGKTFSYAFGISQGANLKTFLIQRMGVDSAYVDTALDAMCSHTTAEQKKAAIAVAAGYQIAQQNEQNLPMFNKQACGRADSLYLDQDVMQQGLVAAVRGAEKAITADSARKIVDQQIEYQTTVYKNLNKQFLTDNARLKGVKVLPSGLQYRVLTEGNGPVATDTTDVTVHYEGKLIDGTVFDSSYKRGKPSTFRPTQVIKGWTEALKMMPEGSKWTLYIPSDLGYGERGQGQSIPGGSTLIFDVEIVKVGK